jgi:hypothetical protein
VWPAQAAAQAMCAARFIKQSELSKIAKGGRGSGLAPRSHLIKCVSSFNGESVMKRHAVIALNVVFIFLVGAAAGRAQVKRVEMKIDGYLCGN